MSWDPLLLIAIGGFFGAIARFGISQWSSKMMVSVFPAGTLFINLSGSFLLGLIAGSSWGQTVYLLLGTGFMGAYTTFSTFNVENVQLLLKKQWSSFMIYVGTSYTWGILLAFAGYWLGIVMKG